MGVGGDIERSGWLCLAGGTAAAAVALKLPFVSFVLSTFVVLAHELGHAATGWLYGLPSIPAFDFTYGGGVTSHGARVPAIAVGVQALLVASIWVFRRNRWSLGLSAAAASLYAATAWTAAHEAVILAMGHGTELLIGGLFLHRALSGRACQRPGERPLYAFVGAFTILYDLRFAYRLWTSAFHRELYGEAKGGGHWMDFSRLADEVLGVPLAAVAAAFWLCCFAPPLVAVLGNWHASRVSRWLEDLKRVE
ncbi:MAG: hypothetical protein MJE66_25595 [Proteobacteria bacterium]|nr:hypothetical protein [Pseudomonadota bacterium]